MIIDWQQSSNSGSQNCISISSTVICIIQYQFRFINRILLKFWLKKQTNYFEIPSLLLVQDRPLRFDYRGNQIHKNYNERGYVINGERSELVFFKDISIEYISKYTSLVPI